MGYLTRYNLSWKANGDEPVKNCEHVFPDTFKFCPECGVALGWMGTEDQIVAYLSENRENYYAVDSWGESTDSVKWYDHDDEMKALSRKFPNVLFTLSGEGEEAEDVWKKYYLGGKCQVARATFVFDEFDKSKLRG